jgi:20S proteasome subunit beta 6
MAKKDPPLHLIVPVRYRTKAFIGVVVVVATYELFIGETLTQHHTSCKTKQGRKKKKNMSSNMMMSMMRGGPALSLEEHAQQEKERATLEQKQRQQSLFMAHSEAPVYAMDVINSSGGMREQARFSPYELNGGTVCAVAGPDYVVLAADTRLSSGYEILTRHASKLHKFESSSSASGGGEDGGSRCQAVLASAGCRTDVDQLRSVLDIYMKMYRHNHGRDMNSKSVAQLLSTTLYQKRMFPYYAFNVLAGIDPDTGKGLVYSYDAIGSFECQTYYCTGTGQTALLPLIDNMIGNHNRQVVESGVATNELNEVVLPAAEVVEILKQGFLSAGERDIYTGDAVEIVVLRKDSCETSFFALKAD